MEGRKRRKYDGKRKKTRERKKDRYLRSEEV